MTIGSANLRPRSRTSPIRHGRSLPCDAISATTVAPALSWLELTRTESKWEAGRRFEFKGANGGEVIGYKGQFSTPYIPA